MRQIIQGLEGIPAEQAKKVVIVYERCWAIGTGRAARSSGANAVIAETIRIPMAALVQGHPWPRLRGYCTAGRLMAPMRKNSLVSRILTARWWAGPA